MGTRYVEALKLDDASRSKALEQLAGALGDFQGRAGQTFLAVRATSLLADVELARQNPDVAAAQLQRARDMLKVMTVRDPNEDEQTNYVCLKSGETETARGHYREAIAFYGEAVKGRNHAATFGAVAVNSLREPMLFEYGGEKWQDKYKELMLEFVQNDDLPPNSWSRAAGELVEVASSLFDQSKMGDTGYANCLQSVRARSQRLSKGDRQLLDGKIKAFEGFLEAKYHVDFDRYVNKTILAFGAAAPATSMVSPPTTQAHAQNASVLVQPSIGLVTPSSGVRTSWTVYILLGGGFVIVGTGAALWRYCRSRPSAKAI